MYIYLITNMTNNKQYIGMTINFEQRMNSHKCSSESTNTDKSTIVKVCKGKRNTAGGYIWKYK